jgi:SulP family sulfate permease
MGGCVLVGQTNLNINAGAKYRLSGIVAGLGLALIILVFGKWIEQIPLVGLIAVMLVVVYQTGDWKSLYSNNKLNLIIIISTVIASLATHNLAIGVIAGSIIFYFSKLITHESTTK